MPLRVSILAVLIVCLTACDDGRAGVRLPSRSEVAARLDEIEATTLGCIDETLGCTGPLEGCNDEAIDTLTGPMDDVLTVRRGRITASEWQALAKSQPEWEATMADNCYNDPDFREFGGGTISPGTFSRVIYGSCIASAYEKRIRFLADLKS